MVRSSRKTVRLFLDNDLVAQARELNIDISTAVADGIKRAITTERERLWRLENAEAIDKENAYVEKHGLPFDEYRQS